MKNIQLINKMETILKICNDMNKISASIFKNMNFMTDSLNTMSYDILSVYSNSVDRKNAYMSLIKFVDIEIAIGIEAGVFEFSLVYVKRHELNIDMFGSIYNDKLKDIIYNLNPDSPIKNEYIKKAVLKDINPQNVAFMKPHEINPQLWEKQIKKKQLKEDKKNNMASTDLYQCYKCGERKTKICQLQTRSADEPMTTFITCLICFNVMKK